MGQNSRDHGGSLRLGDGAPRRFRSGRSSRLTSRTSGPGRAALRGGMRGRQRDQHDSVRHRRRSRNTPPRADRRRLHHARRIFLLAVKPIALRMVKECAEMIRDKFPGQARPSAASAESRPATTRRSSSCSAPTPPGLHRRDEIRLCDGQADEGRTACVHGQAQIRNDRTISKATA